MKDEGENGQSFGFRVVDKRRLDEKGDDRGNDSGRSDESTPKIIADVDKAGDSERTADLDFSSVIKSFLFTGLTQAGVIDPGTDHNMLDPKGAMQTLDILLLLEQKTRGNLEDKESNELKEAVEELTRALALRNIRAAVQDSIKTGDAGGARDGIEKLSALIQKVKDLCPGKTMDELKAVETELKLSFVIELTNKGVQ
ncbi:MAG: DUF1844 domain-containing protein [Deltaproteobacteria bacterium]|nr:DUF1844 domain-containing protein [Deltaproteobacteria bacterium]